MNITPRHLQGEETLEALYTLNQYSLHPSPPFQKKEDWMAVVRERKGVTCHAVFENDTPVSITVSTAMTQNMRGTLYPASGCGVYPLIHPHGERDIAGRQWQACFPPNGIRGRYSRISIPFGNRSMNGWDYICFPLTKIAKLTPASLSPALKMNPDGEIELKLIGEAYETYRDYLADMRLHCHGMGFFDFGDKAATNRNNLWIALAKTDGQIKGLMLYRIQGEEVTKFNFVAYRFYYRTSRARYLMLNWIARHVDQADRVEFWLAADEYPETWLSDIQVKMKSAVRAAMSRVLGVESIGGMEVGEGSFSVQLVDPLCPWNEGTWRFESSGGKLQVSKTSKADCELTAQGLSALIAGTNDPQDFSLRGWGEPNPELQPTLREMFPRMSPFLHENF